MKKCLCTNLDSITQSLPGAKGLNYVPGGLFYSVLKSFQKSKHLQKKFRIINYSKNIILSTKKNMTITILLNPLFLIKQKLYNISTSRICNKLFFFLFTFIMKYLDGQRHD